MEFDITKQSILDGYDKAPRTGKTENALKYAKERLFKKQ
jgi:hypothetical protein